MHRIPRFLPRTSSCKTPLHRTSCPRLVAAAFLCVLAMGSIAPTSSLGQEHTAPDRDTPRDAADKHRDAYNPGVQWGATGQDLGTIGAEGKEDETAAPKDVYWE